MAKLVIYIHARNNVIRPTEVEIKADLPITSGVVLKNMAGELAEQIEKAFPFSQARAVATGLIPLLQHAEVISESWLAGVVLNVPGTIEDRTPRTGGVSTNLATVQGQLDQLQQRYEERLRDAEHKAILLEVDFSTAQQEQKVLQATIKRLQASEKRLRTLNEEAQRSGLFTEEISMQLAEQEDQLKQLGQQRDELAQAKGQLEMQLQQAQFQAATMKGELNQLRQENASLENDKKSLERQLAKAQQAELASQSSRQTTKPASGRTRIGDW